MVPQTAVVLWQLRGYVEDVYCYFLRGTATFTLLLERAGEVLVQEEHADLRGLMDRASTLHGSLLVVGFAPVDEAEPTAPSLLEPLLTAFVRDGTATLHVGPYA